MKLESPLLQKLIAELFHKGILAVLKDRFKAVGRDITKQLRAILDEDKLVKLTVAASRCSDLDAFRQALADEGV